MSESNFEENNEDNDSDDSTPSNLSFEFTGENCQKRVDEFVAITETNDALAQMFLQDRKWNVSRSINDYFQELIDNDEKKKKKLEEENDSETGENDAAEEDKDDVGEVARYV